MSKEKIEPNIILSIDIHSLRNIPMCVTNSDGNILSLTFVEKNASYHTIRMKVIDMINLLRQKHPIDTIIMEENKLFIDKIDRHPDPIVYRNIVLGFSIEIAVLDFYYKSIKNILSLPLKDWRNKVLNSTTKYSIDLYKSHICLRDDISQEFMDIINTYNFYKVICLSESIFFNSLMDIKYKLNKE